MVFDTDVSHENKDVTNQPTTKSYHQTQRGLEHQTHLEQVLERQITLEQVQDFQREMGRGRELNETGE